MEVRMGQTQPRAQQAHQRPVFAQDDEHPNDRPGSTPSLGKISIAIGILAVLIALLVGIIRVGGDIHDLSADLVKINTVFQTKVKEISMALEKQSNDISMTLKKQSKQVEQLKIDTSVALVKIDTSVALVKQIDQLALQLKNAIDHISSITENTARKVNDLLEYSSSGSSTSMQQILEATKNSSNALVNITEGLRNIGNISKSTNKVVDDILGVAHELHNQTTLLSSLQPISCDDIKRLHPDSQTGYYYINCQTVYCNMDELCDSGGGWTRVAYLDMSDATQNCPTGFNSHQIGEKKFCIRPGSHGGSCTSAKFFTNGISYSQICGRVEGYAKNTPDAFYNSDPQHNNIDSFYVDGVSITHGSPRQHVWTFAALGATAITLGGKFNCPCSPGSLQQVPSFVGKDYYCEGGSADPLWDGKDCVPIETDCCSSPYLPWFYRNLNTTTTDYIELRVCCDQNTNDEDVPVNLYEIYIK
uniref:Fibrinogen C-terminal domain-containing protein n=1 Tax=Amphimedon queenslandica TaxID=400682 RepID=A0A1X7V0B7_AMPQE